MDEEIRAGCVAGLAAGKGQEIGRKATIEASDPARATSNWGKFYDNLDESVKKCYSDI
jgi:hypothetical protein